MRSLALAVLVAYLSIAWAAAASRGRIISFESTATALTFASTSDVLPILVDSGDAEAVHIAAETFADDVERVIGTRPKVYRDALPEDFFGPAIIASTLDSALSRRLRATSRHAQEPAQGSQTAFGIGSSSFADIAGKWEAYDIRVLPQPLDGISEALVITGSDRRGTIYALYTLSEHIGISPWYWWADVAVPRREFLSFPRGAVLSHGEPTVKYRGFFLNDEQPVLWNWAKEHFGTKDGEPPFQVDMYERIFELLLRLKGNYMWPAMWASMFAVDGMNVTSGLPDRAMPGPNQALADRMGVVMGTSHHEPMSRNQKEYVTWGEGPWDFEENAEWLKGFWEYGAERAKGIETVFTVGMRGDGDKPLEGANLKANITATQQDILRRVFKTDDLHGIPQMWAMYKEVMGLFANGLKVPDEDDNWGNLMAVLPPGKDHPGGGGIYYHADYVGDPRDYKWTNTVPLAKMWEQLNIARAFDTTQIWILNVGDLKVLEIPLEYFMSLAYDSDGENLGRAGLLAYLERKAARDFGSDRDRTQEVAEIIATYSIYASRRKAELIDSSTYSLVNYNEAERILANWADLEARGQKIYDDLSAERRSAFYQMVLSPILLNANLNRLYISAGKSSLYVTQGRQAANVFTQDALDRFETDWELTQDYHALEGGKWNYMLAQPHINYQYWQGPVRNSMPPISYISPHEPTYDHGRVIYTRYTVENSLGAWPGDNRYNCAPGYACPDPVLLPMDRYGAGRWVDVGSGGPRNVSWRAEAVEGWVKVRPSEGVLTGDGKADTRVWISVDWEAVDWNATRGHVVFSASDGSGATVTLPITHVEAPPPGFRGAVQGDGYVAIEAAHFQARSPAPASTTLGRASSFAWEEIPYYGRTLSGLSVFPVADLTFTLGAGPCARYDFWLTSPAESAGLDLILHLGPSLNFILGKRLALGLQLDDGEINRVQPVPGAPPGALPADWPKVVADEVRELRVTLGAEYDPPLRLLGTPENGKTTAARARIAPGRHSLTVWGVTAGVVLERVLVDMGGIAARGYSYLGPPESVIL